MRITGARVIVTAPGGLNFLTLRIDTDEGIYGLGDASLFGREMAVKACLEDHILPSLIGLDPARIEDTWQMLYRGVYWRRGPINMTCIAAVDMALWDIKGKALNTPVWNLLGGRCREGVMGYGHASGRSAAETLENAHAAIESGYRAVRIQSRVPGIEDMYGVPRSAPGRDSIGSPWTEPGWSSAKYLASTPGLLEEARRQLGDDIHLLHDSHHRLTPIEAGWLGKALEGVRMFWLEDATPAENQASFRLIRQHTTTPLAVGEVFNTVYDALALITEQLIDYIRTSAGHAGGITGLRKIAAVAEPHNVRLGCHGAIDLSPITVAAAAHVGISTHNFAVVEAQQHFTESHEVIPHAWTFADGYLQPGDAPGLGVDIDEAEAARYPYVHRYAPYARLEDGTLWNY
jgi:mannonate dehydratase